jgi:hypothetical protein
MTGAFCQVFICRFAMPRLAALLTAVAAYSESGLCNSVAASAIALCYSEWPCCAVALLYTSHPSDVWPGYAIPLLRCAVRCIALRRYATQCCCYVVHHAVILCCCFAASIKSPRCLAIAMQNTALLHCAVAALSQSKQDATVLLLNSVLFCQALHLVGKSAKRC